jgi:hypothetical protein
MNRSQSFGYQLSARALTTKDPAGDTEESVFLGAKDRPRQIGRCEIVFGSRLCSERSTLYTGRHAVLDVDDARPFEKQRIARESRVL